MIKLSATLFTLIIGSLMLLAALSPALVLAGTLMAPSSGMHVGGFSGSSWLSTNWSGYALTGSTDSVTSVNGSWIVPTVPSTSSSSSPTFAACWVGIDGFSSNTVEQTGTLCATGDYSQYGVASAYSAWYEFYPAGMVELSSSTYPVKSGDVMYATVAYSGSSTTGRRSTNTFTVTVTDKTEKWTFTAKGTVRNAARSSAEWITEAPSSTGGVLPLANFGTVYFGYDYTGVTTCYATVSGATECINSFGTAVQTITMVTNSGVTKAAPSSLTGDGTSFSVTWASAGP